MEITFKEGNNFQKHFSYHCIFLKGEFPSVHTFSSISNLSFINIDFFKMTSIFKVTTSLDLGYHGTPNEQPWFPLVKNVAFYI